MLNFEIELDRDVAAVVRSLEKDIEEASAFLMKEIAEDAPDAMRSLMISGGVSKKGEPPRRQSEELANSIEGQVVSSSSVQISMANHAQWLDPVFGGYLHRPFIERGIDQVLEKMN